VELPKVRGFPFDISALAEASDFKFGTQLGFAKAHHIITPRGKRGGGQNFVFPILFLQWLRLATSNLSCFWGLPRPIIKSHKKERVGVALG